MKGKNVQKLFFELVAIAALFCAVALMERFVPAGHMIFPVLKKGCVYALAAVSMNLLNGFTGLFSLGHAGFMLIGAYTYAVLTIPPEARGSVYQYYEGGVIQFALPWIAALVLAGLAAALFAFAIATLGFAEIIRALVLWDGAGPLTNASNILRKYPAFNSTLFYFAVAGFCIFLIVLLINSSYGRAFKAIRDDEIAAEAMGINLARHKMLSFTISSFFAGVSGALLAMFQATLQANTFKSAMTYEILLIVVIGGMGSVTGSCLASFLFVASSEWWLRFLDKSYPGVPFLRTGFRMVVFSVIIMIFVLFFRKGIMGSRELSDLFRRRPKKKEAAK